MPNFITVGQPYSVLDQSDLFSLVKGCTDSSVMNVSRTGSTHSVEALS